MNNNNILEEIKGLKIDQSLSGIFIILSIATIIGDEFVEKYYLNNDTKITIQNTLSNTNKTIASTEVLVNNSRVKYSEYLYDLYGNLTSEKSFKDDNTSYYETNYTYSNNAYLSRIENIGIKDINPKFFHQLKLLQLAMV